MFALPAELLQKSLPLVFLEMAIFLYSVLEIWGNGGNADNLDKAALPH
jgi:hypothetical protein